MGADRSGRVTEPEPGRVLVSGRQSPPDGGVIVAAGRDSSPPGSPPTRSSWPALRTTPSASSPRPRSPSAVPLSTPSPPPPSAPGRSHPAVRDCAPQREPAKAEVERRSDPVMVDAMAQVPMTFNMERRTGHDRDSGQAAGRRPQATGPGSAPDREVVARATALVPLVREHAEESSEERRVCPRLSLPSERRSCQAPGAPPSERG